MAPLHPLSPELMKCLWICGLLLLAMQAMTSWAFHFSKKNKLVIIPTCITFRKPLFATRLLHTVRKSVPTEYLSNKKKRNTTIPKENHLKKFNQNVENHDNITHDKLSLIKDPCVILQRGKARLFLEGNPLVYSGAIQEVRGNPNPGDYILVTDHHGNFIGRGFYNPYSQYRVRLLTYLNDRPNNYFNNSLAEVLTNRLEKAIDLRKDLLQHSYSLTNAFRLVNGEGDRLSGCIIDTFQNYIVVQSSAYWMEIHQSTILEVLQSIIEKNGWFGDSSKMKILWKQSESRLKQDGFTSSLSNHTNTHPIDLSDLEYITIQENGIFYQISPTQDQKTGFYCDQRENRQLLQELVSGKRVLDLYSYIGGFSLNAAFKGNASYVTAIDSSAPAIQRAMFNYQLNIHQLSSEVHQTLTKYCPINFIEGDAITVMKELKQHGKEFDVIICDPPKLAPTKQSLPKAKAKYQQINSLAMQLINRKTGGYLFTFTCSAAMTQSNEFLTMLQSSAQASNRFMTVMKVVGASSDHPVALSYPEGKYLTGVLLYIH